MEHEFIEIGTRILDKRKARKLDQNSIATALNYSKQLICKWEKGKSRITVPDVSRLANVLQCSRNWLAFGDEPEKYPDPIAVSPLLDEAIARQDLMIAELVKAHVIIKNQKVDAGLLIVCDNLQNQIQSQLKTLTSLRNGIAKAIQVLSVPIPKDGVNNEGA